MLRLLNLPLPIFTAVLVQQIEPPTVTGPGWLVAIFTGAFVVLWFLNAIGRLPGAHGERRAPSFGDQDRAHLVEIHKTVTREDSDKPGWPMVWHSGKESREVCAAVTRLAGLADVWEEDREEWRRDRARMEARITLLEDTVRRQEHALGARG
jgi:hypothetical protein